MFLLNFSISAYNRYDIPKKIGYKYQNKNAGVFVFRCKIIKFDNFLNS